MTTNEDCVLTAFTRAVGKSGDIAATTQSLVRQTLQLWQWDVDADPGSNDPRINAPAPAREAPYAALIDPGIELAPPVLEQRVWYLETHPALHATHDPGLVVCRAAFRHDVRNGDTGGLVRRLRAGGALVVEDVETADGAESNIARAARSVVCPCRNEAGHIAGIIGRLPELGSQTELIFVEGGSTDNTHQEIERQIRAHPTRDISLLVQSGRAKVTPYVQGSTLQNTRSS